MVLRSRLLPVLWRTVAALLSAFAIGAHAQVGTAALTAECPPQLRVAFADTAAGPFLRGHGDDFATSPGLLVDWMRAALRQTGCLERAEFVRRPIRRIQSMIKAGQLDLVAGVAQGGPVAALLSLPPREGRKQEFDLSVGAVEYALYAHRDTGARWNGQILTLGHEGRQLGVIAGSRTEMLAQERGWAHDPAPSDESAWRKLVTGRTSVLLINTFFADEHLRVDAELARHIVKLDPVVERRRLFLGAAPAFAQQQSKFLQMLWRELCWQSSAAGSDGACKLPPE